ncbi:unnamed protein product [Rotaria magnacalcarata]|uniref:Uncharacterized protein n=2 Tax=Rotaria magnacalcarata TaxID=392030 RepID=A0A819SME5_9BILA|nr:unnamed protein product [Rotaria magnacalcarata]
MADNNELQKIALKKSYSNNYVFDHTNLSSLLQHHDSTHSLPNLLKETTSFEQFILEEKNTLELFPSFRRKRSICSYEIDKKNIMTFFHLLPYTIKTDYCSTSNNLQFYNSPHEIIQHNINTKSNMNDVYQEKINDNIDITRQLSENTDSSSQLICSKDSNLFSFYNRSIMNNMFNRTSNSIRSSDIEIDKEVNTLSMVYLLSKQAAKSENQMGSISSRHDRSKSATGKRASRTDDKTISCCCLSKNKMNHVQNPAVSRKYEKYIVTLASHNIPTPMKSIGPVEIKHTTSNNIELAFLVFFQCLIDLFLRIHAQNQSVVVDSLPTDHNCHNTESSIDLQNVLMDSNKHKSSLPLHLRCLVLFEFVNREEHSVAVAELPRSFFRLSRMHVYQKVRERLTIMNLIDMDLTALTRAIVQSFP